MSIQEHNIDLRRISVPRELRAKRADATWRLVALLQRACGFHTAGACAVITFSSDAEAAECRRLAHELKRIAR